MINEIVEEIVDGKKTYSVVGFAGFSNLSSWINLPGKLPEWLPITMPEWTVVFNLAAAFGATILVALRIIAIIKKKKNK